ncbi:hypothetical protein [Streptomyces sp. NPDC048341]|uniref:hypothetical protein n=1 Tax=unclassified Streptomyces TaxID=2593676 RepID=UPI003443A06E
MTTTVTDGRTGEQLAEELLQGVGNEQMRAATRLLGAHRNGTGCGVSRPTGSWRPRLVGN